MVFLEDLATSMELIYMIQLKSFKPSFNNIILGPEDVLTVEQEWGESLRSSMLISLIRRILWNRKQASLRKLE